MGLSGKTLQPGGRGPELEANKGGLLSINIVTGLSEDSASTWFSTELHGAPTSPHPHQGPLPDRVCSAGSGGMGKAKQKPRNCQQDLDHPCLPLRLTLPSAFARQRPGRTVSSRATGYWPLPPVDLLSATALGRLFQRHIRSHLQKGQKTYGCVQTAKRLNSAKATVTAALFPKPAALFPKTSLREEGSMQPQGPVSALKMVLLGK